MRRRPEWAPKGQRRAPVQERIEPYRPGKCKFKESGKPVCGKPVVVWVKINAAPGVSVCEKHALVLVPPKVQGEESNERNVGAVAHYE